MLTAKLLAVIVAVALGNDTSYPPGSPKGPDYCNSQDLYPCYDPKTNNQHLFCKCDEYKCPTWYISENVTAYRLFCMKWHNHWRNVVALGEEPEKTMYGGDIPQAADMNALSWNYEMEDGARCNSKKCAKPFQHDKCHGTPTYNLYGGAGQNLYLTALEDIKRPPTCEKVKGCDPNTMDQYEIVAYLAIRLWYEEFKNMEKLAQFTVFSMPTDASMAKQVGHMVALLWSETAEVGCGAAVDTVKSNGKYWWYFGCHYFPPGVIIGRAIYKIGPAASACPADKPAGQEPDFKGLCGRSELPRQPPQDFFISGPIGWDDPSDSPSKSKPSLIEICLLFLMYTCFQTYLFVLK